MSASSLSPKSFPAAKSTHAAQSTSGGSKLRVRFTRLGFHFLFVGTFAMLGGAIRGLNLLLILAGIMIGALFIQWRWCRRSAEALSLRRRLPTEAFAGRPFRVRFQLTNHSRLLPVWMLRIEDRIALSGRDVRATALTGVGVVPARRTQTPSYECVAARRGRYRFGPSSAQSSFPFSLMSAGRRNDDEAFLDVYPRLLELRRGWERRLSTRPGGATASVRRGGPSEGEFFGLREWRSGDNLRWIHWRTTARLGEPAVRQFEQQRRFDTCLVVDGFEPETREDAAAAGVDGEEPVETAISLAATLLVHLVGSPANRVTLAVAGLETESVAGGSSAEVKRRMLGMLARLQPTPHPRLTEAVADAVASGGRIRDLIVVSPRSMPDAVAAGPDELTRLLQGWSRRGAVRWFEVTDPNVQRLLFGDVKTGSQPSARVDAGGGQQRDHGRSSRPAAREAGERDPSPAVATNGGGHGD